MENNVVRGIIEDIKLKSGISKTTNKPWVMTVITMGGNTYSCFGDYVNENGFKKDDEIQFVASQKGEYLNFSSPVLIKSADGEPAVVTHETIGDAPDKFVSANDYKPDVMDSRQKAITLGQAYNQSCEDVRFYNQAANATNEEISAYLNERTKFHFNNLIKLQEELL